MSSRPMLVMALLLTLTACTRVGAPNAATPRPPDDATDLTQAPSALSGLATLGGQRLLVVLALHTDTRGRGTAHLEIPDLPLTAVGPARWSGDALELDLRYEGACPGDLRIRARRTGDGTRVEGTMVAKDCTGEESGTLALEATAARPESTLAREPR